MRVSWKESKEYGGQVCPLCEPDDYRVETIFCPSSSRRRGWSRHFGDALPSPRPISARCCGGKPGRTSQSHSAAVARGIVRCPNAQSLIGGIEVVFRASQLLSPSLSSPPRTPPNNVRHSTLDRRTARNFPQLRHGARARTHAMAGTRAGGGVRV